MTRERQALTLIVDHITTWGGSSDKHTILDLAKSGLSVAGVIDIPSGALPSPAAVAKLVDAARAALSSHLRMWGEGPFANNLRDALAPFAQSGNSGEFNRPMSVPMNAIEAASPQATGLRDRMCGAHQPGANGTGKCICGIVGNPPHTTPQSVVDLAACSGSFLTDAVADVVAAGVQADLTVAGTHSISIGVDSGSPEGDYSVKAVVSADEVAKSCSPTVAAMMGNRKATRLTGSSLDMARQILASVRPAGQCDRTDEGAGNRPHLDDDRNGVGPT